MSKPSIYGSDDTALASRIASEALSGGSQEDYHGRAIDQEAESKGNKPDDAGEVKQQGIKGDSRAKTKGN